MLDTLHQYNSGLISLTELQFELLYESCEERVGLASCPAESAVSMHYKVVLLAAVPDHLFDLAGGSIPSATSMREQRRMNRHFRTQTNAQLILKGKVQPSQLHISSGWPRNFFFLFKTCIAICLSMLESQLGFWFRFGAAAWCTPSYRFILHLGASVSTVRYGLDFTILFGASGHSGFRKMQSRHFSTGK